MFRPEKVIATTITAAAEVVINVPTIAESSWYVMATMTTTSADGDVSNQEPRQCMYSKMCHHHCKGTLDGQS